MNRRTFLRGAGTLAAFGPALPSLVSAASASLPEFFAHFPRAEGFEAKVPVVRIATGRIIHRFFDTSPISPSGRYAKLDEEFLKGASKRGMVQLKGHRSVGGMRASIYNAMPVEGVRALVDYMREFEKQHG